MSGHRFANVLFSSSLRHWSPWSGEALGLASSARRASRAASLETSSWWPQLSVWETSSAGGAGLVSQMWVEARSQFPGQLPACAMAESGVCSRSLVTNRIVGAFQACVVRRLLWEPRGCSFVGDE